MDKARLKELLQECLGLCDGMGPNGEKGVELEGKDALDGGSDGVTDLGPALKMPADSQMREEGGKKRQLDVIAQSIKKKLGK